MYQLINAIASRKMVRREAEILFLEYSRGGKYSKLEKILSWKVSCSRRAKESNVRFGF
jgi:hypothetical protein